MFDGPTCLLSPSIDCFHMFISLAWRARLYQLSRPVALSLLRSVLARHHLLTWTGNAIQRNMAGGCSFLLILLCTVLSFSLPRCRMEPGIPFSLQSIIDPQHFQQYATLRDLFNTIIILRRHIHIVPSTVILSPCFHFQQPLATILEYFRCTCQFGTVDHILHTYDPTAVVLFHRVHDDSCSRLSSLDHQIIQTVFSNAQGGSGMWSYL